MYLLSPVQGMSQAARFVRLLSSTELAQKHSFVFSRPKYRQPLHCWAHFSGVSAVSTPNDVPARVRSQESVKQPSCAQPVTGWTPAKVVRA